MSSSPDIDLIRLRFNTPVRFGDGRGVSGLNGANMTLSSDSFFSAVCIEWTNLYGEQSLGELLDAVSSGSLSFSSLLPWRQASTDPEATYFLPKPLLSPLATTYAPSIKKKLKKISFIAADQISHYIAYLMRGEGSPELFSAEFGMPVTYDRVGIRDNEQPLPYRVTAWRFFDDERIACGLYWLVAISDRSLQVRLLKTVRSLGVTGIGGKTSSGYGTFVSEHTDLVHSSSAQAISSMLNHPNARWHMALGSVIPDIHTDLVILQNADSRYLLSSRSGFPASASYVDATTGRALKRKNCVVIREGSCFPTALSGSILDLSYGGLHPVYRIGKTLFAGIDL
ncbi:MAG: hypothetical protein GXY60_13285 [Spirochaetales bacterium]|nr:hypothetical protein [Spirochaetales bacterium]